MALASGRYMSASPETVTHSILPPESAGDSRTFFEAVALTGMPMMVSDPNLPDNPVVFANRAFCRLTGYKSAELIGRNCRLLQGPQTDRATIARVRQAVAERIDFSVELLNYRKDGSPFWNALDVSPVFTADHELKYFFASQQDATERHDTEQLVAQAQRLDGLASLAGGIAHEFNNLLTVIRGNLELLAGPQLSPRNAARLERVHAAAERGATLTQSLTSFARRQHHQVGQLNLPQLLRELEGTLTQMLSPSHTIELNLESEAAHVTADQKHLRTALMNVVLNAREAMRAGGLISLSLVIRRDPSGTPRETVLAVTDQGPGMPPEVASRAFEPFFTTKPPGAGTGLGLSMAHGFMRQTGGRMELESREGEGTTVRMIFPAAAGPAPTGAPNHAS